MRIVKTWRGKPDIMNKDIKENQKFGNMLSGFLGIFFVFAMTMFFYEGCSWDGYDRNDKIVSPEEKKDSDPSFNASDWILFNQP